MWGEWVNFLEEENEFYFGHLELNMTVCHLIRNVQQESGNCQMEFRRQIKAAYINFRMIFIDNIFQPMGITKRKNAEREERV